MKTVARKRRGFESLLLLFEREQRVDGQTRTESGALAAEYEWLDANYPGSEVQGQSLGQCGESAADVVSIKTADGRVLDIHFDISAFLRAT